MGSSEKPENYAFDLPQSKIIIPFQQTFSFGNFCKTRNYIGIFYEKLASVLFRCGNSGREKISDSVLECEPDLIDDLGSQYIEVKGVSSKGYCRLFDLQVQKYFLLQMGKGMFIDPKITYAIFLHNSIGIIRRTKGKLEDIVSELSESTESLLTLPFSAVWEIFNSSDRRGVYKTEEAGRLFEKYMTRLTPKEIRMFVKSPQAALKRFSLNPENYVVKKFQVPRKIQVNEIFIEPFPVVEISDRNHEKWLKKFRRQNQKLAEKIKTTIETELGFEIESYDIPF